MTALESYTTKSENTTFSLTCFEDRGHYTVTIHQVTDMSEIDEENFVCTWKIACNDSKSPHAAIHYAGAKVIKNWNRIGRIGKDQMIVAA